MEARDKCEQLSEIDWIKVNGYRAKVKSLYSDVSQKVKDFIDKWVEDHDIDIDMLMEKAMKRGDPV